MTLPPPFRTFDRMSEHSSLRDLNVKGSTSTSNRSFSPKDFTSPRSPTNLARASASPKKGPLHNVRTKKGDEKADNGSAPNEAVPGSTKFWDAYGQPVQDTQQETTANLDVEQSAQGATVAEHTGPAAVNTDISSSTSQHYASAASGIKKSESAVVRTSEPEEESAALRLPQNLDQK